MLRTGAHLGWSGRGWCPAHSGAAPGPGWSWHSPAASPPPSHPRLWDTWATPAWKGPGSVLYPDCTVGSGLTPPLAPASLWCPSPGGRGRQWGVWEEGELQWGQGQGGCARAQRAPHHSRHARPRLGGQGESTWGGRPSPSFLLFSLGNILNMQESWKSCLGHNCVPTTLT